MSEWWNFGFLIKGPDFKNEEILETFQKEMRLFIIKFSEDTGQDLKIANVSLTMGVMKDVVMSIPFDIQPKTRKEKP